MTKIPKGKASEVLKARKYGAPPTTLERVLTPQERMRLLIGLPSIAAYFILRMALNFGIVEALAVAAALFVGLGFATGVFKRAPK